MIVKLISLGLWVSPFIFLKDYLIKDVQEYFAAMLCLALGLFSFYKGKQYIEFKNKFALMFLGWSVLCMALAVKYATFIGAMNTTGFWHFKPLFFGMCYLVGIFAVTTIVIDEKEDKLLSMSMIYPAIIISLIVIFQKFGYDEFFGLNPKILLLDHPPTNYELIGMLGQPTLSAAFIGMCIPIALQRRKFLESAVMAGSLFLIDSKVAFVALGISAIWLLMHLNQKKLFGAMMGVLIFLMAAGSYGAYRAGPKIVATKIIHESSGRIGNWINILDTCRKTYIFGNGPGSFRYVFHVKKKSNFLEAHNEYLEIFFNVGIVGLVLFILAIIDVFRKALHKCTNNTVGMLASLVFVCVAAGGTFVWQLGPICLYCVVLVGLLNNQHYLGVGGNYERN